MGKPIKGSLDVCKNVKAGRRLIQAQNTATITAPEQLTADSAYRQKLDSAGTEDVILPDALTLQDADAFEIEAVSSTLNVKTYHATTPVLLKALTPGRSYKFTLTDNGTAAGIWHVNYLEQADISPSDRYVESFNAVASWGAASGGANSVYTLTILQSVHLRGISPQVDLFEESGSDFVEVDADVKVLANGDIEITTPENPNCRFAGRAVII